MERRKDHMYWKALTLIVNLTFLLLAVTIMTILLKNENYRADILDYKVAFERFQEESKKVMTANIGYMEGRINRLAETQDSYLNTTSSRLNILEKKMDVLEKQNKANTKIINNNNSTAIINK